MSDLKKLLSATKKMPIVKGPVIYFLMKNEQLVYIGQSRTVHSRLTTHLKEKDFDDCQFMHVSREDQDCIELALIKTYRPKYNAQKLSPINSLETKMLLRYSLEDEILKQKVRTLRPPEDYGPVAFFEGQNLIYGLYDDDDTEVLSEDAGAHNDDCEFGEILCDQQNGDISFSPDEFNHAQEECNCDPYAIVLLPEEGFVSITIKKSRLHDISECKELADKISEIEFGVLKTYGCNIEKLKQELKQAEEEHFRGQNYCFEGLVD